MPKAAVSSTVVIVQAICTHWGKSERGGASAVLRNRVPETLAFPCYESVSDPLFYVIHQVYYGSRNGFTEPTKSTLEVSTTEPANIGGIFPKVESDRLKVFHQYDRSQGAPERFGQKIEALSLSLGQWGRILYNGRHTDTDGHWYYEKRVYNVGLFAHSTSPKFTQTEPVKVFNRMAHLL